MDFLKSNFFIWLVVCISIVLPIFYYGKKAIEGGSLFNTKPCFVLLTDFGYDFAVGTLKGVILSKLPHATIIDLDHSINKFNVISGGFVLAKSYRYFPKNTIFICVIDPGVGTKREPVCIATKDYTFIGPNNGLFDFVLEQEDEKHIYIIDESYLTGIARTFHGRDLFAPAAVDFYNGILQRFKKFDENHLVHSKSPDQIIAVYIDSFGNIKTNKIIDSDFNKSHLAIIIKNEKYLLPFVKTFKDVCRGELLCYYGSNGTLEIAVNQGSAARLLGIEVGDTIVIE